MLSKRESEVERRYKCMTHISKLFDRVLKRLVRMRCLEIFPAVRNAS
jgi:hypothetical protein